MAKTAKHDSTCTTHIAPTAPAFHFFFHTPSSLYQLHHLAFASVCPLPLHFHRLIHRLSQSVPTSSIAYPRQLFAANCGGLETALDAPTAMPPRSSFTSSFPAADANNEVICPLRNHDGSNCRKKCLGVRSSSCRMPQAFCCRCGVDASELH